MGLPGIRTFVAATAKLGLFLGSLGLALVVGELLARRQPSNEPYPLVYVGDRQDRPSDNFVKDVHTGWRLRPHHAYSQAIDGRTGNYQSNAQGFRAATDFGTFRDLMTELNAGFLDLNDPKLGVPPGLHFHGDSHINEAGHRYVAEALLKWIRANQPALSALAGAPR